MDSEGINPKIAAALNFLVWGLGYIYAGKVFKGTGTFFLFAFVWGFYLIDILIVGFSFSLLIDILIGYFVSGLWFAYDGYSAAVKAKERY
jgi:TM2 domain-containing membrane protein YozV